MTIYTRFGSAVEITEARIISVWVEKKPAQIKWHYEKPAKVGKRSKVEVVPIWHYRGTYGDKKPICDGKWIDAAGLVADGGWTEIYQRFIELWPEGETKYKEWNRRDSPSALHFFPPVTAKEVA